MSTWRPSTSSSSSGRGAGEPVPVGAAIDRVVAALGGPSSDTLAAVFGRWPQLVGEAIAAHSRPLSLRHGTLLVAVDEPAWATQLRYLTAELLDRFTQVVGPGAVEAIKVTVRGPKGA